MTPPVRIGIDLDGVIINHRQHKCDLAREFGVELEPWQANSNVMRKYIPEAHYDDLQDRLYGRMTVEAPPVEGALERLAQLPGEVFIVSARRPQTVRSAQEWLSRNRLYDIIHAERIFFCGSDADKRGYCDRLGINVFLDDKVKVLEYLPKVASRVLFDEDGIAERLQVQDWLRVATNWEQFLHLLGQEYKTPAPR